MNALPKWLKIGHALGALLVFLAISCYSSGPPAPAGSLEVFNDGSLAMTELFVTPSTSSTWGVDQLAPNALLPGDTHPQGPLFPRNYDVKAFFSDGSSDEAFDVLVQDGFNTHVHLMNTGTGTVSVFNNSGLTIDGVYLTPASAGTWGPNQAGPPLLTGQTLDLTGIPPDTYDLRVTFSAGGSTDYLGITVASAAITPIQVN